jgi:hypothetical protein
MRGDSGGYAGSGGEAGRNMKIVLLKLFGLIMVLVFVGWAFIDRTPNKGG